MRERELNELIEWFTQSEEATMEAREMAERDRDYYDGTQWTADEIAELQTRGQPVITINRIAPKIDFILGSERKARTDPKAWPRTPQHEDAAHAVTDALRYVLDYSKAPQEISAAFSDLLIEGMCGGELSVKPRGNSVDICFHHTSWDRLFYDPRSREVNFKDAKYRGTVAWMDVEDAVELFGEDKRDIIEQSMGGVAQESTSDTFDDRPKRVVWAENARGRKRIRVVQIYWREGYWRNKPPYMTAVYCWGGFLDKPKPSSYLDEYGQPDCPLVLMSCKIDRENQRYGMVRGLISPQDEINKRRSKALHLLSMRQTLGEDGAVDVVDTKHQMGRPDGHVKVTPGMRFELLPTNDLAAGQFQLLQEAKMEMDAVGANAALTGKDPRAASGIAIQSRQQGGAIELEPLYDNMRAFKHTVYVKIWAAIRQFWTAETWIRVTDNEQNLRWVGLNRPVTAGEALQKRGVQVPPPDMLPPEMVQQLMQPVGMENNVAELDVDIIIDEAPDSVALQQEQFEALAQMVQAGLPIPPDVVIEASSLRNKEQLLERIRSGGQTPEQQQAAQQAQAQQQQIQEQGIALEFGDKEANIRKTQAETIKIMADIHATGAQASATALGAFQQMQLPPGGQAGMPL